MEIEVLGTDFTPEGDLEVFDPTEDLEELWDEEEPDEEDSDDESQDEEDLDELEDFDDLWGKEDKDLEPPVKDKRLSVAAAGRQLMEQSRLAQTDKYIDVRQSIIIDAHGSMRPSYLRAPKTEVKVDAFRALFYGHPISYDSIQPSPFKTEATRMETINGRKPLPKKNRRGYKRNNPKPPSETRVVRDILKEIADVRMSDTLAFIRRFRYATPLVIARIIDESVSNVLAFMDVMQGADIVSVDISTSGPIYTITPAGLRAIKLSKVGKFRMPSIMMAKHNILTAILAAEIERGAICFPFLDQGFYRRRPIPLFGKPVIAESTLIPSKMKEWELCISDKTGLRQGEAIVSEYEISSAYARFEQECIAGAKKTREPGAKLTKTQETFNEKKMSTIQAWEENKESIAPELRQDGVMYFHGINTITGKEYNPDMVLKRPRKEDGSPQSVCIEVELSVKREEGYYYRKIKSILSQKVFGHVVYVTPSVDVHYEVSKAMYEVDKIQGIDGEPGNRCHIYIAHISTGPIVDEIFDSN